MIRRLVIDCSGNAAAEMALVAPLLLALMLGAVELGNYFLSEHVLLKGVRDGAVYASRQNILTNYDCSAGTPTVPATVVANTKALVRKGQLTGGTDRLPKWSDPTTTFTVTVSCATAAGGTTLGGMYNGNGGNVPIISIAAQLPYRPVLGANALVGGLHLRASEQAAATGL